MSLRSSEEDRVRGKGGMGRGEGVENRPLQISNTEGVKGLTRKSVRSVTLCLTVFFKTPSGWGAPTKGSVRVSFPGGVQM